MNDFMIDLETMDIAPTAAIVSIGVIQCDIITGGLGEQFYRVVELKGQTDLGLTIDTGTLYWWMEQDDGARQALTTPGRILLRDMCTSLNTYFQSLGNPQRFRLWGNGASFDNAIIRNAFLVQGLEFPIPFWNDRDMRTIVGFYPDQLATEWKRNNLRKGTHHNSLDDAKHQVHYCSHILQELGVKQIY